MGEGKVREVSGERMEGYGVRKNGNARKNNPKTQHIWHLGRPLGASAPCHALLESCFQGQHSIASILNRFSFKLDKTSNVARELTIFRIIAATPGGYRPMPNVFRKMHAHHLPRRYSASILHRLEVIKLQR